MLTMMKKLCFVVCAVLAMTGIAAYAADNAYECGSITYTDGGGNTVTAISEGTLKASIAVSPKSESSKKLLFALMLYRDNKLIDSDCQTKVADGTKFEATVTIPDSETGYKTVAVLWDNAEKMKAVCAAGEFPGGINLLRSLKMDCEEIEGFTPDTKEYTHVVSNGETVKPVLDAEAINNAADVRYIGGSSFPGKTVVELTPADGGEKVEYTVSYQTDKPLASGTSEIQPSGEIYNSYNLGTNLSTGDGGDVTDTTRTAASGRLGSRIYGDRNYPQNPGAGYTNELRYVSDEYKHILGCDYIMGSAGGKFQTQLKLYRSATVYVFSSGASAVEGWTKIESGTPLMTYQDNKSRDLKVVSRKHFDVTDGENGEQITIPAETKGGYYLTVIVYDGYTTVSENEE